MTGQSSAAFPANAAAARRDAVLTGALERLQRDTRAARPAVLAALPEFDALRDAARDVRDAALDRLDTLLETFEARVAAAGGQVHWCEDAAEARRAVLRICREAGARRIAKGKSMVTEEIGLNDALAAEGFEVTETDLGEYVLQLRGEAPSHIVIPAVHLTRAQFSETFRRAHLGLPPDRSLDEPRRITDEAREVLRAAFLGADVGITGANFLVAETGSIVLVTNEGNGDLAQALPRTHIAVTGIEKAVASIADALTLTRVLARSATGQEISAYTTFATGARRPGDADGPEAFHVVLVDNGRSALLAGRKRQILRCIRCGACQTACPVYGAVGGHAYGAVYGGPVGAALTPALAGHAGAYHLPEASSFCGACEEVCPVRIPLPALLRHWREDAHDGRITPAAHRRALALWRFFAARPALYRPAAALCSAVLRALGRGRGRLRRLPFAGGWTGGRDLPVPDGPPFFAWPRRRGRGG